MIKGLILSRVFHGLESIERKVNSGEAKVGFALFATRIEDVIDFADQKLTNAPINLV